MLNDIRIGVSSNHPKTREVNTLINVVGILYSSKLMNLQTNGVKYVVIDIEDVNTYDSESLEEYGSWVRINSKLDLEMFLQLDSKDRIQLDLLHSTMLVLANKLNWDISELIKAYNYCIENNYTYRFPLFKGKDKVSPNRSFRVSFRVEWVSTSFKTFICFKNKNKEIQSEFLLIEWEGWIGEEIYSVKFEWLGNDSFCLFTTYKGLRGKEWVVDLTMPITLLSPPF